MKNTNLIVLALAAVAVYMITRANKASTVTAGMNPMPRPKPGQKRNPYLDMWPTGPNGEGLF